MQKTLVLALVLLLSAAWSQAEQTPSSDTSQASTTLQGCLKYSRGHYNLTDSSGTKHPLKGNINTLKPYIGQEVEVMGKPAVKTTGTTVEGAASTAKMVPVFAVESLKHIADTCTSK